MGDSVPAQAGRGGPLTVPVEGEGGRRDRDGVLRVLLLFVSYFNYLLIPR